MLRVRVKPSALLSVLLAAVHLAAGATLIPLDLPITLRATLAVAIAASLARSLWLYALLRSNLSIIAVDIEDQERCTVQTRSGVVQPARILGSTYVSSIFSVINLRVSGMRFARHIVLTTDTMSAEEFRRTRVALRWAHRSEGEKAVVPGPR